MTHTHARTHTLQALRSLFTAGSDTTVSAELVAQLLNALFDYRPNMNDSELYCAWMDVMAKGTVLLEKCVQMWMSYLFHHGLLIFSFPSHVQMRRISRYSLRHPRFRRAIEINLPSGQAPRKQEIVYKHINNLYNQAGRAALLGASSAHRRGPDRCPQVRLVSDLGPGRQGRGGTCSAAAQDRYLRWF